MRTPGVGLEWMAHGRPRRVPRRNRVATVDAQIRGVEFQQALEFATRRIQHHTEITAESFSSARDVMTGNRDRDLLYIRTFLAGIGMALYQHVVRIFDLEWRDNHTVLNANQFGDPDRRTGSDTSINWIFWRGHIRFRLPSTDTRPKSW